MESGVRTASGWGRRVAQTEEQVLNAPREQEQVAGFRWSWSPDGPRRARWFLCASDLLSCHPNLVGPPIPHRGYLQSLAKGHYPSFLLAIRAWLCPRDSNLPVTPFLAFPAPGTGTSDLILASGS